MENIFPKTVVTPPKAYLSTSGGKWCVIHRELPLCGDTTKADALACAARYKVDISHGQIWNGESDKK